VIIKQEKEAGVIRWTIQSFSIFLISILFLWQTCAAATNDAEPAIELRVDRNDPGKPLAHFWSTCVGAGRANEGLRASWLEQLKLVHDACGFQYVRFHGLFHDDMFVYRQVNGRAVYNFQYVDDLFDRMLAMKVRPFVELGFNPVDPIEDGYNGQFWWAANATPPSDLGKWSELVDRFTRHCIDRYGIDEVRSWYFEVWNEPNLQAFFHGGSKDKYFALYKASAETLKKIDPLLRVGGPATSNFTVKRDPSRSHALPTTQKNGPSPEDVDSQDWQPVWVADFLTYCHENQLPVDFISTHPYPQDFPIDDGNGHVVKIKRGIGATQHDLALLRQIVAASPYPNAEIQLTEWSSSPSSRDYTHDSLQAATFVAKTNLDSIGLVNSLSYWTFTDVFEEKGAGDTIFHGGFGIINYQGIVKPTFHAYRFLNALGDELLVKTDGAIATRDSKSGRLAILAYRYPPEVKISLPTTGSPQQAMEWSDRGSPTQLKLTLTGLSPGTSLQIETLDKSHGNALAAWGALGAPNPPTREQTEALKQAAMGTKNEVVNADASGRLILDRTIEPWSLVLVKQQ
jgi:xylan 1,4-beta-xylosidase